MDRDKTIATFIAGVLVGGGAVYLSPTQSSGPPAGEMGAPLGQGQAPGQGQPPGAPGGNGAPPPGAVPAVEGGTAPPPTPGEVPSGAPAPPPNATPEAPPLPEATPSAGANTPAVRLEKHLSNAPVMWKNLAEKARTSTDPSVKALAGELADHVGTIPRVGDLMPPLQEVTGYMVTSKALLDRCKTAGMDVTELQLQIDGLLRPARGRQPAPNGVATP